jgi:dipeptidyl aminopeptidase/acylaminoacyl peptidase
MHRSQHVALGVSLGVIAIASLPIHAAHAAKQAGLDTQPEPTLLLVGPAEGQSDGPTDIYVHPTGGSEATSLTTTDVGESDPAISPDGQRIAFVLLTEGHWQLAVMGWDGMEITVLTSGSADARAPAWSPDGSTIAFQHRVFRHSRLFLIGADGIGLRPLTSGPADRHPTWAPDGSGLVFSRGLGQDASLWQVGPDGSDPHPIGQGVRGDWPVFSPDGSRIAFADRSSGTWQIFTTGSDGAGTERLTQDAWENVAPTWSTDGAWIAFQQTTGTTLQIVQMFPDGTGQMVVVNNGLSRAGRPNAVPALDDTAYEDLAAKTTGFRARDDGRIVWGQDGTYANVIPARMVAIDPALVWLVPTIPSTGPAFVSVGHSNDNQSFYEAVWSASGTCFFLQDFQASTSLYGVALSQVDCTANDAPMYATEQSWP